MRMNFCRDCKKMIYKKDQNPIFKEFGVCNKCAEKLNLTEKDLEIFTDEKKYYKYTQERYFMVNKMYSNMIKFGYATEQELNEKIPNWKDLEKQEAEYRKNYYEQMKNYWPEDKIEKFKKQDKKEYEYYTKRLT